MDDDRIETLRQIAAEIRAHEDVIARLKERREDLIRDLTDDGIAGAAKLGRAAGLTRGRIWQITQKRTRANADG